MKFGYRASAYVEGPDSDWGLYLPCVCITTLLKLRSVKGGREYGMAKWRVLCGRGRRSDFTCFAPLFLGPMRTGRSVYFPLSYRRVRGPGRPARIGVLLERLRPSRCHQN